MEMTRILVIAFLASYFLAGTAWSKGPIVKIVVHGDSLSAPIEIVDPEILDRFTIWNGPGVGGFGQRNVVPLFGEARFIANWSQRILSDPLIKGKAHLVQMYIGGREQPRNTYEVLYVADADADTGYVYLPSQKRDNFGEWNTFQIYRGVEGAWYRSTQEWEEVIRPLLKPN
jgi:hypothetical protein